MARDSLASLLLGTLLAVSAPADEPATSVPANAAITVDTASLVAEEIDLAEAVAAAAAPEKPSRTLAPEKAPPPSVSRMLSKPTGSRD